MIEAVNFVPERANKRFPTLIFIFFGILIITACGGGGSSGSGGSPGNPTGSTTLHPVEADGAMIGYWLGSNLIQLPTGYVFYLNAPPDGASTTAQVSAQALYYATTNCSGQAYAEEYGVPEYASGFVFVGFGTINSPSLFYVPASTDFSQIQPFSEREYNYASYMDVNISFSSTPASGSYILNFNGGATAPVNWNDTAAQVESKISAGIPSIEDSSVTVYSTSILIYFQTAMVNDAVAFTVTNNTLKDSGNSPITITSSTSASVIPGTCQTLTSVTNLNTPLVPAQPNNPSVTGLSTMSFAQPITVQ